MRVNTLPRNTYTPEFKADAVVLFECHPQLSYAQAAKDLGISVTALKVWVRQARKDAGMVPTRAPGADSAEVETEAEELARLRVENQVLRDEKRSLRGDLDRLAEEREILRKATKYFAAETNW